MKKILISPFDDLLPILKVQFGGKSTWIFWEGIFFTIS